MLKEKKDNDSNNFLFNRSSGILLHPTSLPGKFGIGEIGKNAKKFIDLLNKYNQKIWQVLPLGPTGYGNSPYQCFSAFAGNPLLISIDSLIESGLLDPNGIPEHAFSDLNVEFEKIINFKWDILKKAYLNFIIIDNESIKSEFNLFIGKNKHWLEDFSLFMALKFQFKFAPWTDWVMEYRYKDQKTIDLWKKSNTDSINFQKFVQFIFFRQWSEIKEYAKSKGVLIIGDMPIFVAHDSADVWSNKDLFYLNKDGSPTVVAGVPPDLFSETGQRWGNPLYNWGVHSRQKYRWWINRFEQIFDLVDIVRVDHFRGFEAYWEIPSTEKTAIIGKWVKAPGNNFFKYIERYFKYLPIIAENLGVITPEVEKLRNKFNFPGMNIIQFGFDEKFNPENNYLIHNFEKNSVVYTGTHDNETTYSWFNDLPDRTKSIVKQYFNVLNEDILSSIIIHSLQSVAIFSIFPLQDILRLNYKARLNFPGKASNNWEWRFDWSQISEKYFSELAFFSKLYGR